jgi:hypothetical protein
VVYTQFFNQPYYEGVFIMAIITGKQFSAGIKTLGTQTAKTRELIQELLITAVFYAERDGDIASIQRVLDAVQETKSYDMWKIHAWLKKYEAPVKPSDDGKSYVFDAKKRHLAQGDSRDAFAPYETVMRTEAPWYELAKKDPTPGQVWNAETAFDNFLKKLAKEGYGGEVTSELTKTFNKLKSTGKLVPLALTAEQE